MMVFYLFFWFVVDNVIIIPRNLSRELGRSDIVLSQSRLKDNDELYGAGGNKAITNRPFRLFFRKCLKFQLISTASQSTKVVLGPFLCSSTPLASDKF